jgi:hypothetical protein
MKRVNPIASSKEKGKKRKGTKHLPVRMISAGVVLSPLFLLLGGVVIFLVICNDSKTNKQF